MIGKILASFLVFVLCAVPLFAQSVGEQNNLWIMWERIAPDDPLCIGDAECEPDRDLRSHFMINVPSNDAATLFNQLEPSARRYGNANLEHDQLPICFDGPDHNGIDTLGIAYADRIDTLRGLPGIFADLRGVRGPAAFRGQFGQEAQEFLTTTLTQEAIPMLTREQVDVTLGRPTLTMRYSPEVIGCRPWSVSISVKQDLLLARDVTLMVSSTTWSASKGQSETDADFSPRDAMQQTILAFVDAWEEAHSPTVVTDDPVSTRSP